VSQNVLIDEIKATAERVAKSYDLVVFEMRMHRESIGWVLRVTLDRENSDNGLLKEISSEDSVSIRDCEKFSRDLSVVLDAEEKFAHKYTLEVSSPGLDRPLRHLNDCRRFIGKLAKFITTEPIAGQFSSVGRIIGVNRDSVEIETELGTEQIRWLIVSKARLEVEF
tara:strand:- start:28802 stop:29302 length:501 start_codon:yes stop_codon:yes gene_type:complete